jgi:hypothetical protein
VIALLRRTVEGWYRFWFTQPDLRQLELVRIGVGLSLFFIYFFEAGRLDELYTEDGWVPLSGLAKLRENPAFFSVFYRITDLAQVTAIWALMLVLCLAFTVGLQTSWIKWIVWILHISFQNRAPEVSYGVDSITSNLLIILCVTPVGRTLSVDAWLRRDRPPRIEWLPALQDARASVGLRLVQIQMVIVFFFAGTQKLQGADWWDGDAIWYAMTDFEFSVLPLAPFAEHMWLVNLLTYGSILVELGYAFLVWDRKTRPIFVVAAIVLHIGVAISLGLVLFAVPMIAGHLAFAPSTWLDRVRLLRTTR